MVNCTKQLWHNIASVCFGYATATADTLEAEWICPLIPPLNFYCVMFFTEYLCECVLGHIEETLIQLMSSGLPKCIDIPTTCIKVQDFGFLWNRTQNTLSDFHLSGPAPRSLQGLLGLWIYCNLPPLRKKCGLCKWKFWTRLFPFSGECDQITSGWSICMWRYSLMPGVNWCT